MSTPEVLKLIQKLRKKDQAAFAEFIGLFQETVRGFTALWAPSRDEADDIAQEVFLVALTNIQAFDERRDLKAWLLGIARNLTRQSWRRNAKVKPAMGEETLDQVLERHAQEVFEARARNASARLSALRECLHGLPSNAKALFSSYALEEASSLDLAHHLNTTDATVRATFSRIRRGLKECIERRVQLEGAV